ncbi:MAG: ankyrin repeat domain-containing protein [Nitrospira sp.]|nr:ankyrin repeat domain-containing protein [Nitrospira sp.]
MPNRFLDPNILATCNCDLRAIESLGADALSLPFCQGATPLTCAIALLNVRAVRALLQKGANPNQMDLRGGIPLIYAALQNNLRIARYLLNAGARANERDINRRTALHYAFYLGHADFANLLIRRGAQLNLTDADGQSPLDYAQAIYWGKDEKAMEALAREHGAKPVPSSNKTVSPYVDADYLRLDNANSTLKSITPWEWMERFAQKRRSIPEYRILFDSLLINLVIYNYLFRSFHGQDFFAGRSHWLYIIGAYLLLSVPLFFLVPFYRAGKSKGNDAQGLLDNTNYSSILAQSRASIRAVSEVMRHASRLAVRDLGKLAPSGFFSRLAYPFIYIIFLLSIGIIVLSAAALMAFIGFSVLWLVETIGLGWFMLLSLPIVPFLIPGLLVGPSVITMYFVQECVERILSFRILERKREATKVLETRLNDLMANPQSGDVLYLRPFLLDRELRIGNFNFEGLLVLALSKLTSVVALGYDTNQIGPLAISATDSTWRDKVSRLTEAASMILIIPSDSDGVRWEIASLRARGYLYKTVFIAPPGADQMWLEKDWNKMRQHTDLRNLEIPPYCESGFLFTLKDDGTLNDAGPLGLEPPPSPIEKSRDEEGGYYYDDDDDNWDDDDQGDGNDGSSTTVTGDGSVQSNQTPTLAQQYAAIQSAMLEMQILTVDQVASLIGQGGDDGGDGGGSG